MPRNVVATGTCRRSENRISASTAPSRDAGTRQHHGVTRRLQHVGRPMHLILGRRRVARHVDRQRRALGRQLRDVFGKHDERRTRPFGRGQLERFADHLRRRHRQRDHVAPLRDGSVERHDVDELVGLLVDAAQPGLRRDGDERMGVELRVRDPEHQIDRPGTERGQAHAGPARERPVRVGHERGASLVPRGHEPDGRVDQRVDHVEVLLAREAEHELDALVLEALDDQPSDGADAIGHSDEPTRAVRTPVS